jgi:hypothetical protein
MTKKTAKSTFYAVLSRHGWRKVLQAPEGIPESTGRVKKTLKILMDEADRNKNLKHLPIRLIF